MNDKEIIYLWEAEQELKLVKYEMIKVSDYIHNSVYPEVLWNEYRQYNNLFNEHKRLKNKIYNEKYNVLKTQIEV